MHGQQNVKKMQSVVIDNVIQTQFTNCVCLKRNYAHKHKRARTHTHTSNVHVRKQC